MLIMISRIAAQPQTLLEQFPGTAQGIRVRNIPSDTLEANRCAVVSTVFRVASARASRHGKDLRCMALDGESWVT